MDPAMETDHADHARVHSGLDPHIWLEPCDSCHRGGCDGGCGSVAAVVDAGTIALGEDLALLRQTLLSLPTVSAAKAAELESKYKAHSAAVLASGVAAAAAAGGGAKDGPHPHAEEYRAILKPVGRLLDLAFDPQQNQPLVKFHCFNGRIVYFVCDHCERPTDDNVKVSLREGDLVTEVRKPRTLGNLSFSDKQLWDLTTVACIKEVCGNHEHPEVAFMVITPLSGCEQLVQESAGALTLAEVLRSAAPEHLRGLCVLGSSAEYGIATVHLLKGGVWQFENGAKIHAPSTDICRSNASRAAFFFSLS